MLVTSDTTLLVGCTDEKTIVQFDLPMKYGDYWRSIRLGLAYLCELRLLALQLRVEASQLLARSLSGEESFRELINDYQSAATLLARLRTVSDAATLASATYAAEKFREIALSFEIPQTMREAQKNLDLIHATISQREAQSLERSQWLLGVVVAVFATTTIALGLPPFWESSLELLPRGPRQLRPPVSEIVPSWLPHLLLPSEKFASHSALLAIAIAPLFLFTLAVRPAVNRFKIWIEKWRATRRVERLGRNSTVLKRKE